MIYRGRVGTLVLLLFTMACGGGATGTPGSTIGPSSAPGTAPDSPFTEVDRSIVAMIPAVGIGDDGTPVEPGFIFSADAPQVTVVAIAGEITDGPMELTWFQVTEAGEQELFTHTVQVTSFQAAYSVGTNPGMLTSGTYRVEATLQGESVSTQFEVTASEELAEASGTLARTAPAGGVAGQSGQGATSGPPVSGDSGAVATPVSEVPSGDRTVRQWVSWTPVDSDLREIMLTFEVFRETLSGGDWEVQAHATMGGSTRTVYFPMTGQELIKTLTFDPCVHPGGSDLPGTQASFFVAATAAGDAVAAGDEISTTLGPDESKPQVTINSVPQNKSRVEPGDEIVLDATARESREQGPITMGPTWQEGLNSFKLIANPGGLVGEEQRSDTGSAQPCDRKQWSLNSQATYTVPDDAPAVIKICGEALDFAGNFSDPEACNEYYTGEAVGALSGVTGSYILARDIRTDSGGGYVETDKQITEATFSLVAVGENRLEGQGHQSFERAYGYAAPTDCPFASGMASVEWDVFYEGEFAVNSDGSIDVQFTGTPRYGPDYVYTYTIAGCEENNFTETVSGKSTVDISVTLVDGEYYFRDDHELDANQTGEDYNEVVVEATNY